MIFVFSFVIMCAIVALRLWKDTTAETSREVSRGSSAIQPLTSMSKTSFYVASIVYAVVIAWLGYLFYRGNDAIAITLGYLLAGTWTDLRSNEVYLPLTIASAIAVIGADAFGAEFGLRIAIAAAFAGVGYIVHKVSRGRSFGLADVLAAAIVLLGFGPVSGAYALGYAAVLGAAIAVILISLRLADRKTAVPMFPFIALGAIAMQAFGQYPRLAIGGPG